jgi:uncharacterized protein YbjT (DUF2867 family)
VRALVRPESRARTEALVEAGVELAGGDLRDPSSLQAACRGVDTVVSTATAIASQTPGDSIATVDGAGHQALVQAAAAAGVRRFVFVSFAPQPEEFPLQSAKRDTEAALVRSSLDFAVLHAPLFQEVWLSPPLGFDFVEGQARIYGPGEAAISWISVDDVADAAVAAAAREARGREVFTLTGPEMLTPHQVIDIFEQTMGRAFRVEHVPVEALRSQLNLASDPRQRSFFALALQYSRGTGDLGEPPPSWPGSKVRVQDYARRLHARTTNA